MRDSIGTIAMSICYIYTYIYIYIYILSFVHFYYSLSFSLIKRTPIDEIDTILNLRIIGYTIIIIVSIIINIKLYLCCYI